MAVGLNGDRLANAQVDAYTGRKEDSEPGALELWLQLEDAIIQGNFCVLLAIYMNLILFFRPEGGGRPCQGSERRYQACSASQCLNVPRMTVREFAVQICERAKEVDSDLTGSGLQRQSADCK